MESLPGSQPAEMILTALWVTQTESKELRNAQIWPCISKLSTVQIPRAANTDANFCTSRVGVQISTTSASMHSKQSL